MTENLPILSTKILKPGIIQDAAVYGINIFHYNFIETDIQYNSRLRAEIADSKQNLVFTSVNGVEGYLKNITLELSSQKKYIFCLSGETLKAAEKLGNCIIAGTAKDAASLAEVIIQTNDLSAVSFICGNKRRDELPELLKKNNIDVEEIEVYHSKINRKKIGSPYFAVLYFSPSAVESFFEANKLEMNIPCFCIGNTTANTLREHTKNEIIIAEEPSQESILQSVLAYYKPD